MNIYNVYNIIISNRKTSFLLILKITLGDRCYNYHYIIHEETGTLKIFLYYPHHTKAKLFPFSYERVSLVKPALKSMILLH